MGINNAHFADRQVYLPAGKKSFLSTNLLRDQIEKSVKMKFFLQMMLVIAAACFANAAPAPVETFETPEEGSKNLVRMSAPGLDPDEPESCKLCYCRCCPCCPYCVHPPFDFRKRQELKQENILKRQ